MKVTYENVRPLVEGLKQMGRVVVLGIAPILLLGINVTTGVISINWNVVLANVLVIVITAVLVGVDKDRHLTGKIEGDETKVKGLTQF